MLSKSFIGGVITGAAGLAAAAFIDHKITESKFSTELKTPEKLDPGQVVAELNNYFFKQQAVLSECNKIVLESCDNIVTPMPLPWDSALQKAANSIGGGLSKVCRKWSVNKILDCKKQAENLYRRYMGVFDRANVLLTESGRTVITHPASLYTGKVPQVDNAADNEDWGDEFERLADQIRDGIEHSCNIAEQLISALEQEPAKPALEAANN